MAQGRMVNGPIAQGPILILAQQEDAIARRVLAETLRRLGSDRVRLVSDRDLLGARRWDHRIVDGRVRTEIELADGPAVDSWELGAVLNRLGTVSQPHFALWDDTDAAYAVAETHALWLSWLEGIEAPVFNRATARGLSGASRGEIEWLHLATLAGFAIRGWELSTNPRRYAHREFPAAPFPAAPFAAACRGAAPAAPATLEGKPPAVPLAQAPALFLEPVGETTVVVTSLAGRIIGRHANWWRSEFRALHELTSETLLQGTFALRNGGSPGRKRDWRLCRLSNGIDFADDEVIRAIVDLLEHSAASAASSAAAADFGRVGIEQT